MTFYFVNLLVLRLVFANFLSTFFPVYLWQTLIFSFLPFFLCLRGAFGRSTPQREGRSGPGDLCLSLFCSSHLTQGEREGA